MNVVVHKYLTGVRKVQQNIRDFLCCKHAKVFCLGVLWARLERGYVSLQNKQYYTIIIHTYSRRKEDNYALCVFYKTNTMVHCRYVKKMLERRKEQKRSTGKLSAPDSDMGAFDRKTLIEMKNQAKLWERIDSKMEDRIKSLKATGVIVIGKCNKKSKRCFLAYVYSVYLWVCQYVFWTPL